MKLIGIDVGTGGTRVLMVDTAGKVVGSKVREHAPFRSPQPGWAEQDPEDWWQALVHAIPALLTATGTAPEEIAAIGLSGQMHGAVLLDATDRVLRPALIWCDQRTAAEAAWLTAQLGTERLIQLTSNPALTNFTLTKLLWVRSHESAIWQQFRSLLLPKDYVRFRLTGEKAMDVADASGTLLLHVAARRWSSEMLAAVDMPESILPALYECHEIAGTVTAEAASLTGLRAGTPVVAGAGDQAAGALGMGIVRPGDVSATIGTSGVVFAATDQPFLDPHGRLHTFCHAVPDRWHVMGVTQAAGLSLRWFRDTFANTDDPEEYARLGETASTVAAGADGLLWAPYLMGERTPHLDPEARGALVGLTASHRSPHVVRAIMEGVAFSLKDTLSIFAEIGVPARAIRLGGGGAHSPVWRQIQADVYGQTIEIVAAEEGAAYGAALLAGVGAGVWPSVDAACDAVIRIAHRISPQPSDSAKLQELYLLYRRLYPSLQPIFHGLHAASTEVKSNG
ncbi:MAG TPA: xylulokinase [Acidobacteriaceae bacterium]|nr:xylulokinase [Acidobacteriaceae bacterium]